ncbi:MAG: thioredoxin family protein [Myxococcota bacterium]
MLSASLLLMLTVAAPTSRLPWVHDDWAAAEKAALSKGKLVAVDVWATWCHSCLSMKNFVLEEKPLGAVADQHIWLSLDYDQEKNADFFRLFPVSAFPTFLVVDPKSKTVVGRWVGSGTAEEMAGFFKGAKLEATDPISRGARAIQTSDFAGAREIFEKALAEKPADRSVETRLIEGWIEALSHLDPQLCAEKGAEVVDKTEDTAPGLDTVSIIADCASGLDEAKKKPILGKIKARLMRSIETPAMKALAVDDQSGVYATLADVLDGLGEKAPADAITERRLAVLEAAAEAAKTPKDKATFDAHRVECALRLKRFEAVEKALLASEKAFPKDYNPPARLALIYRARGDLPAAEQAIDRALKLGYGPRRMRLWTTKIDILIEAKRSAEAKAAITAARAEITKMDPALVKGSFQKALDEREAKLK